MLMEPREKLVSDFCPELWTRTLSLQLWANQERFLDRLPGQCPIQRLGESAWLVPLPGRRKAVTYETSCTSF